MRPCMRGSGAVAPPPESLIEGGGIVAAPESGNGDRIANGARVGTAPQEMQWAASSAFVARQDWQTITRRTFYIDVGR